MSNDQNISHPFSFSQMTGFKFSVIATVLIVTLGLLNGLSVLYPSISPMVDLLTRPNEQSFVEYAEALLWISSFLGFSYLFLRQLKIGGPWFLKISYLILALMSFLVFGEETSWGQHLGLITPSEDVKAINAQNEFNLHNTNVSLLLGLAEDHPLYSILSNAGNLVSPLFQLFCVTAFGIVPLLFYKLQDFLPSFFSDYPIPSTSVSYFVILAFIGYLIVDKLFFDVAIVFELAIALTGFMVVLDRNQIDKSVQTIGCLK